MNKWWICLWGLMVLGAPSLALGNTLTYDSWSYSKGFTFPLHSTSEPREFELDHYYMYSWRIGGVTIPTAQHITSASITFKNIRNWDSSANQLFMHLLDTSLGTAPIQKFRDAPTTDSPPVYIKDNWIPANYPSGQTLITPGTGNVTLSAAPSFGTTGADYTYNFTSGELMSLATFIANGNNFALGFDPNCHYWNNGIIMTINTGTGGTGVPEPATLTLFATGALALASKLRRKARKV